MSGMESTPPGLEETAEAVRSWVAGDRDRAFECMRVVAAVVPGGMWEALGGLAALIRCALEDITGSPVTGVWLREPFPGQLSMSEREDPAAVFAQRFTVAIINCDEEMACTLWEVQEGGAPTSARDGVEAMLEYTCMHMWHARQAGKEKGRW